MDNLNQRKKNIIYVLLLTCIIHLYKLQYLMLVISDNLLPVNHRLLRKKCKVNFHDYFDSIQLMSDKEFKQDMRMSKAKFQMLHSKLQNSEAFRNKPWGRPKLSSEKCLCIGLWVLATPDSYRSIARRFNVEKSTVVSCIRRVIEGLLADVCKNAIRLPCSEEERSQNSTEFYSLTGRLKNIIGAIDGTHIKIEAPRGQDKDTYFNRKKDYAILAQGICDANLFFIDIDVRWPGSVHDSRALRTSEFYQIARKVCKKKHFLIGDSAYPLKSWLVVPYKRSKRLDRKKKYFNKTLSQTRQVVERAFGLMKNKFRRLKHLHMLKIKDSVRAIVACCILHNICRASEEYARVLIFGRDQEDVNWMMDQDEHTVENPERKRLRLVEECWQYKQ